VLGGRDHFIAFYKSGVVKKEAVKTLKTGNKRISGRKYIVAR
jgi:hypothetical protein